MCKDDDKPVYLTHYGEKLIANPDVTAFTRGTNIHPHDTSTSFDSSMIATPSVPKLEAMDTEHTIPIEEAVQIENPSVSARIRDRLLDDGVQFFSGDNIADYIHEGEHAELIDELTEAYQKVLDILVIDTDNDHNTNGTARRVAKMYINEIFRGRYYPEPQVTEFPNVGHDNMPYEGIYVVGPIDIRSTCAHHIQGITGRCWIGILPKTNVIGLSKFNRIVDHITRRPGIQEEMVARIANRLVELTGTEDVAVLIDGEHHCVTMRGVMAHENSFKTPIMRGLFLTSNALRREFYSLVNLQGKN